uniref:NADH dehydrogenase subunit 6 n=1 Tax=Eudiplozoon sp. DZ-2018 TaxID=2340794 RepID=A0A386PWM8_9PLAT|nr:NADH dehydrogenase subunit 6 [Eudiplozoon sp. DZ-2018]
MLGGLFFSYFFLLVLFSFVQNPILCSLILMVNTIILGWIVYSKVSCWLSVILLLVYLGGVYVVNKFVSSYVQNDNEEDLKVWNNLFWFFFIICFLKFFSAFCIYSFCAKSTFWSEGIILHDYCYFYLFLCFFLLFIFYLVSFVFCCRRSG